MRDRKTKIPLPCERLTDRILAGYYEILAGLGSVRGTPVGVFRQRLRYCLEEKGIRVELNKRLDLMERGRMVGHVEIDMLVEDLVVVCLCNVQKVTDKHRSDGTYQMECGGYPAGLLLNYGSMDRRPQRLPQPLRYRQGPRKCTS